MKLIFDCNGLLFRWYNKKTEFFPDMLTTLYSISRSFNPDDVIFCFDYGRSVWRLNIYPEYKANRDEQKSKNQEQYEFLYEQLSKVYEYLTLHNEKTLRFKGIEADDLIAYITLNNYDTIVISEDFDLLQLPTRQYSIKKQKYLDLETIYGCSREQFILAKAIAGDTADNIKGIQGVGMKTALKTIDKLHIKELDVDEFFKRLENIKRGKREDRILENREIVERNLKLVDLITYNNEIIKDVKSEIDKILGGN